MALALVRKEDLLNPLSLVIVKHDDDGVLFVGLDELLLEDLPQVRGVLALMHRWVDNRRSPVHHLILALERHYFRLTNASVEQSLM